MGAVGMRLIADPALENVTGRYFDMTEEARPKSVPLDHANGGVPRVGPRLRPVPAG